MLTVYKIPPLEELKPVAEVCQKSGFWSDCQNLDELLAKMLYGWEFGLSPLASLQGVWINSSKIKDSNGNYTGQVTRKLALTAPAMACIIANRSQYRLKTKLFDHAKSVIEIIDRTTGQIVRESTFDAQDAEKAGLTKGPNHYNYAKYTRNMLHHRNISNIAKTECADAFNGQPVYTPEELDMPVDENGNPTDSGPVTFPHLDNTTYINEELAAQGKPSIQESKARAKAEKEAVKAAMKAAAAQPTTTGSGAGTTPAQTPGPATPAPAPQAAPASPPPAPAAPSSSEVTTVAPARAAQPGKPGPEQLAQILQVALEHGWNQQQANAALVAKLQAAGVDCSSPAQVFATWTWDHFNAVVAHFQATAPEA